MLNESQKHGMNHRNMESELAIGSQTVNGRNNCLSLPIVIFPIFLLDLLIIIPVIAIVSIGVNDIDCNILLLQIPTD